MTLDEIVERLEKATGPDRQIDEAIFELMHGRKRHVSIFEQYDPSEKLPAYTGSVDAALTLVPSRFTVKTESVNIDGQMRHSASTDYKSEATGANLPIAISLAALKARMVE